MMKIISEIGNTAYNKEQFFHKNVTADRRHYIQRKWIFDFMSEVDYEI